MRCEQCRDLLSPYLDGVCSEKENKLVDDHLAVCSNCREELEQLRHMVQILNQLTLPPLPDGFADALHRKLDAENLILFPPSDLKAPRKQSWIAAAIAGLALVGGIYASTVLPIGSMVASWQDKNKQNDRKPNVAINNVIDRITHQEKTGVADNNAANTNPATPKDNKEPVNNNSIKDNPEKIAATVKDSPGVKQQPAAITAQVESRFADSVTSRLKVKSASDSRKQVIQIAEANGYNYSYNSNGCGLQPLSGPIAQGITLKVEAKDVEQVLQQLAALGEASKPAHSTIEMTDQFKDVQAKIDQVKQERDNLAVKIVLSPQEQDRLNELNNQIQTLTKQQADLEKEANMVIINIYFVEEVNL